MSAGVKLTAARMHMRYLIDPEFRPAPPKLKGGERASSAGLRHELSVRNQHWAKSRRLTHEVTMGLPPAILYREDQAGVHGNFLDVSYRAIKRTPEWSRRLRKVHTSARRALLSRDPDRCELDSSNSSDALLMNVFCHPSTLQSPEVTALLAIGSSAEAVFGYRPGIALKSGKRDTTEIDLKLGTLLIEAKLTESDFQTAPIRLVERYRDFASVFDTDLIQVDQDHVRSYQLIRGILAAASTNDYRFCVLCDARRGDLIEAWHRVLMAVRTCDLRWRLQLLTWQELARCLPPDLRGFLDEKFGIVETTRCHDL